MSARTPISRSTATVTIALPLSDKLAKAIVRAAEPLSVEPWELAVYALAWKAGMRR